MSNFNEQAILEQANQLVFLRAQSYDLSQEEATGYAQFVASFNQVAVSELAKETGILLQEGADPIAIDDEKALQALSLFGEGVLYCILRCRDYNLPGELSEQFTQQVALHVYEQAKQVVAATHGQEHTPEFQFTQAQQAEFVTQGAESALIHYINEYEKAYGPINAEAESELPQAEPQPTDATPSAIEPIDNTPAPESIAPPMEPTAALPESQSHPQNGEKYAAVALLLDTLPPAKRARLMQTFDSAEKELITFYSHPQNIEAHLDIQKVAAELKQLKRVLASKNKKTEDPVHQGIHSLVGQISREKLLSCLKDERPVVQRFVMAHYAGAAEYNTKYNKDEEGGAPSLSPRLQGILYQHLSKRLASELQQSLPNTGSP
jgi:hypothetical protein